MVYPIGDCEVLVIRKKYRRVISSDIDQVVKMYTTGSSMEDIADLVGLSKTKVHDILHCANSSDCPIFLCHNLAVNLRKYGLHMKQYADLIRARNILAQRGIQPEDALSQIRDVTELCYKQDLHPQTLVTSFSNFRKFVFSVDSKSPESLKLKVDVWLKAWEFLTSEIDESVKRCAWLRSQIDILERRAPINDKT